MKAFLRGFYFSFPIQLFLLHFKKHQIILLFWVILFATVGQNFMTKYGADSLFLAPEYLGKTDFLSTGIVGISIGIFIMSWNITCFILFSRYFLFLATTTNPFLKFCINNAIIPIIFLIYYLFNAVYFTHNKELMGFNQIVWLIVGFVAGLLMIILISFLYFFRADKSIIRKLAPVINDPVLFKKEFGRKPALLHESRLMRVEWYYTATLQLKKVRGVEHYSKDFLDTVFSRHHFAGVLSILIAFIFLIVTGYFIDDSFFQLPAAASVTIFFAILIAVSGAISYFLQNWSLLFLLLLFLIGNYLYQKGIIDPTNKAYGLAYVDKHERPAYNEAHLAALSTPEKMERDKRQMIKVLNAWKAKQKSDKPYMIIINTSGGGNRSAAFTMNVLQRLDSLMNGMLMHQTMLITGASGGMLGATYFRALDYARQNGAKISLQDTMFVDDISKDLLNPILTNMVARDLAAPVQQFEVDGKWYNKDRAYAFEQKLNENTRGLLNVQLKSLKEAESKAQTPLLLLNSIITQDGRKLMISTQPIAFMMRPPNEEVDAVDFGALFVNQDPGDLRLLTALRMNATFPYVLPNVWLPSSPVIDVMDAGLRDNFGIESSVRFIQTFSEWIKENTRGVVIVQTTDRRKTAWEQPYSSNSITDILTRPMLLFQYNWHKMQGYTQDELFQSSKRLLGDQLERVVFQYISDEEEKTAALNFHLSKREKKDIQYSLNSRYNQDAFNRFMSIISRR